MGRSFGARLVSFLLFILLSVVTLGVYPFYFAVTRMEKRNQLLAGILDELSLALIIAGVVGLQLSSPEVMGQSGGAEAP